MTRYLLLFLTFIMIGFVKVNGQSLSPVVISTAGSYETNQDLSITWTLGEPVIDSYSGTDILLTQGFQQSFPSMISSSIWSFKKVNLNIYPNPTQDKLYILRENTDDKIYLVELYDINGQKILTKEMNKEDMILDMKNKPSGTYLLRIIASEGYKTFKIINQ